MALIIPVVVLTVGLALFILAPHPPAAPARVQGLAELEDYCRRLVTSGDPPSLSVAVVKGEQTVYTRAFGWADRPRAVAATSETVYHWWSMTKIPTALAILQLQEQGCLSLDDAVVKHLPWFDVTYPSADGPAIALRHLLQHSSGLPDVVPAIIGWVHADDNGRDQTALVRKLLPQYKVLKFKPGERAVYSNLNYMVLGAIIEAVTAQTYESYVEGHILRPLGMSQTGFVYSASMAAHEASGTLPVVHLYTPLLPALVDTRTLIRERQGNLFWFRRVYVDVTPSTGLIGPASDVARLMLAYLQGGALEGASILKPESISLMTDMVPVAGRGLGWAVTCNSSTFYLDHAGGGPGFATFMRIYPSRDLGVTILSNGTDLDGSRLADLLGSLDW